MTPSGGFRRNIQSSRACRSARPAWLLGSGKPALESAWKHEGRKNSTGWMENVAARLKADLALQGAGERLKEMEPITNHPAWPGRGNKYLIRQNKVMIKTGSR